MYCTATAANPEDIVVGEGQSMEFVPADKAPSLNLADNAGSVLRDFVSSEHFRQLAPAATIS